MKNQYHSTTQFLDRWLPDSAEQHAGNKIENKIRARILVGLLFSNVLIISATFLLFLIMHLTTDRDFSTALIFISIAGLILALQTYMFYRLGNIGASAMAFSMTFFAMTLAVMIATGGWHSPARLLFFCAPMISFLVDGRQEGFYITGLVLVIGLIVFVAEKFDWQFFQVINGRNGDIVEVVIWIISINIMVTCLTVYDAVLHDFSKRINLTKKTVS